MEYNRALFWVHFYSVFTLKIYPLHILNTKVVCHLFADDNSIHSRGTNVESVQCSLQEGLNDVSKWCDQNRMIVHPGKTKSMVLASRQKHQLKALMLNLIPSVQTCLNKFVNIGFLGLQLMKT